MKSLNELDNLEKIVSDDELQKVMGGNWRKDMIHYFNNPGVRKFWGAVGNMIEGGANSWSR
ncbi:MULTISPECIES: hypothetical protein [Lactobacillus]|uniref:hypothetical protein n=1 Tax=Lactobacillus TaxID=1578 RepID=UPI0022DEBF18|nr:MULTISPECIES: hypothetical protein [Lactobacillus]MDE7051281.1 hypothetical protein [Lactobacillus sp.]